MSSHSSSCASSDYRMDTKVKLHKVTSTWTIENFKFHEAVGNDLISLDFCAIDDNETKWYLNVEPNGKNDEKDCIGFFIYLSAASVHKEVFAEYSACLLDGDLKEISEWERSEKVNKFTADESDGWGWAEFQRKNEAFKDHLLIDDKLTIKCEIIYSIPDVINNSVNECNTRLYPNVAECNHSGFFELLLENHNFADVVLSVKGNEYPAHKAILAACSPVFAAMFKHNAKENEENRMYIEDMDKEVLSEMLRYIYTGKCEKLTELAYGLLAAGDKYDLDHLKMICAEELYKNLSVENAASILALAHMHGVQELKNEVIKFIISKPAEVFSTEGWKKNRSFQLADDVSLALSKQLMQKD